MSLHRRLLLAAAFVALAGAGSAFAAPANDTPLSAEPLDGCSSTIFSSTSGAANDVWDINCFNVSYPSGQHVAPYGGDVFYKVSVPWSFDFSVLVEPLGDWDVSLYVFSTATNPSETCLVASDVAGNGFAEMVQYQNSHGSGLTQEYIIGVDSWRLDSAGDFRLSVTCDFAVPVGTSNFSTLKSRYSGD